MKYQIVFESNSYSIDAIYFFYKKNIVAFICFWKLNMKFQQQQNEFALNINLII